MIKGVFLVTFYCLTGLTAGGHNTRPGIIAVDPQVIPLKTRITANNREFVADDTGAYIRGNHIDVWVPSCRQAINLGTQHWKVIVPNEPIRRTNRRNSS